jgi:hypothetical protein
LRTIYDSNDLALGAEGLTDAHALGLRVVCARDRSGLTGC